jgi:hypothetical protein
MRVAFWDACRAWLIVFGLGGWNKMQTYKNYRRLGL